MCEPPAEPRLPVLRPSEILDAEVTLTLAIVTVCAARDRG